MFGKDRLDAKILKRFAGNVFVKMGAVGVYCGCIRSAGIGVVLKVGNGAERTVAVVARDVLARFFEGIEDLGKPITLNNANGIAVGDIGRGRH